MRSAINRKASEVVEKMLIEGSNAMLRRYFGQGGDCSIQTVASGYQTALGVQNKSLMYPLLHGIVFVTQLTAHLAFVSQSKTDALDFQNTFNHLNLLILPPKLAAKLELCGRIGPNTYFRPPYKPPQGTQSTSV